MSREELSIYDEPPELSSHLAAHDDLAQSCAEKARDAGKLEEYRSALDTYRQFIPNRGALCLMALARVGVDVTALETLFLMREQEARDRLDRAMKELRDAAMPAYWPPPGLGSNIRDAFGPVVHGMDQIFAPYRPLVASSDVLVGEASEWAAKGYPVPVPDAIEAMRPAGASARDFADNIIQRSLKKQNP